MKKLFMLLAVAGIFASCSKETPVVSTGPKAQDQEAPVTLSDGGADGEEGIRLSLRLDVEDFEEVAGGFDATQQARAVFPSINTGAADKKLIDLRAYVDGPGAFGGAEDRLTGMIYLYNKTKDETIPFNAPFRVYNDGKSIGYDGLVSGFAKGSKYREFFDRMVDQSMANCYVSVIIGNDVGNLNFTNKGPHVITSWGDDVKLPKNFVMLKSEHNPVGWRNDKKGKVHEISTAGDVRMKLRMMGYLMMLRIRNSFSPYVRMDKAGKPYRALRPAMRTYLDLSPTLSAARTQVLTFSGSPRGGQFSMRAGSANTEHFKNIAVDNPLVQNEETRYMQYKHVIDVPVSTTAAGDVPAKGDLVVAMYFPQVDDHGAVGIRRVDPYFYDGSAYSMDPNGKYEAYNPINERPDKIRKSAPAGVGSDVKFKKSLDNRVYYPIIDVKPALLGSPRSVGPKAKNYYTTWISKATWEAIP